jgi:hypothetical protein
MIYIDSAGTKRMNWENRSYRLDGGAGVELGPRQLALIKRGSYGKLNRAYLEAHEDPTRARWAWKGIANAMGDHTEITPGWKSQIHNFRRKEND